MALTYPLALPAAGASRQTFEPKRVDYLSPETGGRLGAMSAGVPLWYGKWTLGNQGAARSDEWSAFVDALDGPARYFLGRDTARPYPLAYQDTQLQGLSRAGGGAFDGSATAWARASTADGQSLLELEGLPAGLVLSRRDYVGFRWETEGEDRRALVRLVAPAVAAGDGTVTLTVRPAVHTIVPAEAIAHLDEPACLMKLIPSETQLGDMDRRLSLSGTVAGLQDLQP